MFCVKCGKQIDDNSKFCPFCGQPVPNRQVKDIKSEMPVKKAMTKQMKWGISIAAGVVIAIVSIVTIIHNTKEKENVKQEVMADNDTSKNTKEGSSAVKDSGETASAENPFEISLFEKKITRKDIFEALQAYQDYFLDVQKNMYGVSLKCQFVQLDDDKIPECIILDDMESNSAVPADSSLYILSYKDGKLIEYVEELAFSDFWVNTETGVMLVNSWSGDVYYGESHTDITIIRLSDGFQTETASCSEYYDEAEYVVGFDAKINGQSVESKEEVTSYLDSFRCTSKIELEELYRTIMDDRQWIWNDTDSHPIVNLYILQNATCYGDSWPFISFCEYKDGILTVEFDDGEGFSCPVAKDCFYDTGYSNYPGRLADSGIYPADMNDLNYFGEWVAESRENYAAYGDESYEQNAGVSFYIIDGEVVEIFGWSP